MKIKQSELKQIIKNKLCYHIVSTETKGDIKEITKINQKSFDNMSDKFKYRKPLKLVSIEDDFLKYYRLCFEEVRTVYSSIKGLNYYETEDLLFLVKNYKNNIKSITMLLKTNINK